MIYAYDQRAQMPTRDIYDTQMMAMAINAAKDMYDRNERKIEKFRDKYGSFYSPTQSHMDYYNQNFDVNSFIDDLYNRGIDPLRSSEGRAAVSRWINTRPLARLEQMKKSAETYEKYQENVAKAIANNEFNPEFEKFLLRGRNINDLKVGEMWDRIAPTRYQDLNQYTGHLFDKMEDEYMNTDSQGRDWYGVSEERRKQALTPMMGDLLSTDLGRFHYEQARANAAAKFNRTPTEQEVMQQFADDVITATREYDHRNWKENPEYKRRMDYERAKKLHADNASIDHYYKMKERANTPGYDANGNPITGDDTLTEDGVSLKEHGYNTALANTMGTGYDRTNMDYTSASKNINRVQKEFGKTAGTDMNKFINRYTTSDAIHIEDVKQFHGGKLTDLGFRANMEDVNRLKSVEDVVTNTRGYRGKSTDTSKLLRGVVQKALDDDKYVEVLPQGGTYGAQTKKNQYAVDTPVVVRIYENSDGTGNYKDYKGYWNMGWDSMSAPTSWNDELAGIYNMMDNPANVTSSQRISNRYNSRSLLYNNFDLDDIANVFPYDRDASSDTQATKDRLNAGSSAKNATMYK